MDCFTLVDRPRPGWENMALDDFMLEQAAERSRLCVRLYRWANPTLSLGYFQPYADRELHAPSANLDVVRRATGGGAIVHHHEWTYSIAIPESCLASSIGAAPALYDCIHEMFVRWARSGGLPATQVDKAGCSAEPGEAGGGKCSFLCFERRTAGDVIAHGSKILGSAQRRLRGAILQHGSLLLERSEYAPSLPGVRELIADGPLSPSGLTIDPQWLLTEIVNQVTETLGIQVRLIDSFQGLLEADNLSDKYKSERWTQKR